MQRFWLTRLLLLATCDSPFAAIAAPVAEAPALQVPSPFATAQAAPAPLVLKISPHNGQFRLIRRQSWW